MRIRLGYVSISNSIYDYVKLSTITYTNYKKKNNYDIIDFIIKKNLNNLYELLLYNIKNDIHFYRISSNLIPLATKEDLEFNYLDKYDYYYKKISKLINQNKIRTDMHPSNYCVLNSTKEEVVKSSIEIIKYHYNIMDKMGIKDKIIILHVGSSVLGKKNSITRFINNFKKFPKYLQNIIAIENDDKVFNIEDCLYISSILNIPIVLDYHHFNCNNTGICIDNYLKKIINSWEKKTPKMHFSSPKSKRDYRSHSNYINVFEFIKFIDILSKYKCDIDIMLEAKEKDEALFRLVRELKYKSNFKFIDSTTIEI
jgi:UV DNA damage endonuclease